MRVATLDALIDAHRLIVCHYDTEPVQVASLLEQWGYQVAGRASAPSTSLAWMDQGFS